MFEGDRAAHDHMRLVGRVRTPRHMKILRSWNHGLGRVLFQPQEKCGQKSYSGRLSLPSGVGNPGLSSPWP